MNAKLNYSTTKLGNIEGSINFTAKNRTSASHLGEWIAEDKKVELGKNIVFVISAEPFGDFYINGTHEADHAKVLARHPRATIPLS